MGSSRGKNGPTSSIVGEEDDDDVLSLGVQEEHHLRAAKELRHRTAERLWKITEELNILYKDNWTALANREIVKFQKELFAAELLQLKGRRRASFQNGGGGGGSRTRAGTGERTAAPSAAAAWSFSDSFLYSLSLITTVGKSDT